MSEEKITKLRDDCFGAVRVYLTACGWKDRTDIWGDYMFHMTDPLTEIPHRCDFAFFIQTERDQMRILNAHLKEKA